MKNIIKKCPLCLKNKEMTKDHYIYRNLDSPLFDADRTTPACKECNNFYSKYEIEANSFIKEGKRFSWKDEDGYRGAATFLNNSMTALEGTTWPTDSLKKGEWKFILEPINCMEYVDIAFLKAGYLLLVRTVGLEKALILLGHRWPIKLRKKAERTTRRPTNFLKWNGRKALKYVKTSQLSLISEQDLWIRQGLRVFAHMPYNSSSYLIILPRTEHQWKKGLVLTCPSSYAFGGIKRPILKNKY